MPYFYGIDFLPFFSVIYNSRSIKKRRRCHCPMDQKAAASEDFVLILSIGSSVLTDFKYSISFE